MYIVGLFKFCLYGFDTSHDPIGFFFLRCIFGTILNIV
uniref:Uncharacterized protein n=1 Tax=Anguilla anguilla TaxID=7936 RepID=A0A0E9Q7Z3_ANGAN